MSQRSLAVVKMVVAVAAVAVAVRVDVGWRDGRRIRKWPMYGALPSLAANSP
jgi:hypothetical protein